MKLKYIDADGIKREGTGKKHANGYKWRVILSQQDGKFNNITAKTVVEAREKVKKKVEAYKKNQGFRLDITTVAEMLDYYYTAEVEKGRRDGSLRHKRRYIRIINEALGNYRLEEITQEVAQNFINEMTDSYLKRKGVNENLKAYATGDDNERVRGVLKQAFNLMIEHDYKGANPVIYTHVATVKGKIKKMKRGVDLYSIGEKKKLLRYIRGEFDLYSNQRLRAVIALVMATGMRMSEIERLKWEDMDLTKGIVKIDGYEIERGRAIDNIKIASRAVKIIDYIDVLKDYKEKSFKSLHAKSGKYPVYFLQTIISRNPKGRGSEIMQRGRDFAEHEGIRWLGTRGLFWEYIASMRERGHDENKIIEQLGGIREGYNSQLIENGTSEDTTHLNRKRKKRNGGNMVLLEIDNKVDWYEMPLNPQEVGETVNLLEIEWNAWNKCGLLLTVDINKFWNWCNDIRNAMGVHEVTFYALTLQAQPQELGGISHWVVINHTGERRPEGLQLLHNDKNNEKAIMFNLADSRKTIIGIK